MNPRRPASLSLAEARALLAAAQAAADALGVPGAVAVCDAGGHLVALETRDGTMHAAPTLAAGKAATAAAFLRPTSELEKAVAEGRAVMLAAGFATPQPYVPLAGGAPLWRRGTDGGRELAGAIAVAGTLSARADEEVLTGALVAWAGI